MTRYPDIDENKLSVEQRKVHDAIKQGPRGVVEGPLRVWLQSPELAERAQALGAFCRYGTVLPPRLSELAILVTGAAWKSGFEWAIHAPIAEAAGISSEITDAIRTGSAPQFEQDDERILYQFAFELTHDRKVSESAYRDAVSLLGLPGTVELVGILGYYTLISMTINAFEVPLPSGAIEPFE